MIVVAVQTPHRGKRSNIHRDGGRTAKTLLRVFLYSLSNSFVFIVAGVIDITVDTFCLFVAVAVNIIPRGGSCAFGPLVSTATKMEAL